MNARRLMVRFREVALNFLVFLAVGVRPSVLLPVHRARLQGLVDFREGELLRVGADGLELGDEHVG